MRAALASVAVLFGIVQPVLPQQPEIFPGGIVNAATFKKLEVDGELYAGRGQLVSIFGKNLAAAAASAQSFPLPKTLAGTSVTVGGIPAPLLYVSPDQINLQVPSDLVPFCPAEAVVVTTASGSSAPVFVKRCRIDMGIFTLDGSGCGRGAVYNIARDGSFSLNAPENSVEPGGILTVFGTGITSNILKPVPVDGAAAPANPPATAAPGNFFVVIGGRKPLMGGGAFTLFAGQAPGYAGLAQFNIRVPDDLQEGCSIPLWLWNGPSQIVPVSVRRGGGQCADPPEQSLALLRWKKTVVSGFTPSVTEELLIDFSAAPGKQAPGPPPIVGVPWGTNLPPIACPGFEDRSASAGTLTWPGPEAPPPGKPWVPDRPLDAGILTVQAAGSAAFQVAPQIVDGRLSYVAKLPAGAIKAGTFTVTGAGGPDVGPFTTSVDVPPPIEITTVERAPGLRIDLAPGSRVPYGPLYMGWTGGTPGVSVIARFRVGFAYHEYQAPALRGNQPLFAGVAPDYDCCGRRSAGDFPGEFVVVLASQGTLDQSFEAPGLTLGGRHGWIYEFRFTDLKF